MDWTEIQISVPVNTVDAAGSIAHMVVPYGIYIEDYSHLEEEAREIAHIDLIDEELLQKDRSKGVIHIYISPQERPSEAVQFLRERLESAQIPHEITVNACKNEDWENNWKQYFKPIPIGERLLIRPTWEDEYEAGARRVLHLEPGLAFGTGSHATTRLCLEALEGCVTPQCSVLDVGCGSGILSIASLLLGAERAVGVDIDKYAVKTAVENGETNGFGGEKLQFCHGNLTDCITGQFDVIAANIVADVILLLAPQVTQFLAPDGVFLTSGIIEQRVGEIIAALEKNGLRVTNSRESEGWYCLESRRAP